MQINIRKIAYSLLFLLLLNGTSFGQQTDITQNSRQIGEWMSILDVTIESTRPVMAVASDGSYAIAWEALREGEFYREWQIGVQRFSAGGQPIGPTHYFDPESGCLTFDSWTTDYMHNVALSFGLNNTLWMAMSHTGWYSILSTEVWETETTLGAIDAAGQIIDLADAGHCVQSKQIYVGADDVERPQIAAFPDGGLLLMQDGYHEDDDIYGEAHWRNISLRAFDINAAETVSQFTPHTDPGSANAYHAFPDVDVTTTQALMVWQTCPFENETTTACSIDGQYLDRDADGTLNILGDNFPISIGGGQSVFQYSPSLDMNTSGNSVVVWRDDRNGPDEEIYAQILGSQGQKIGTNILISQSNGIIRTRPEVAMAENGSFMVVWSDSAGGLGWTARGRQFDAVGTPLTNADALYSDANYETWYPTVAATGNQFIHSFMRQINGTNSIGVFSSTNGTITAGETLETPTTFQFDALYPNPFTDQLNIKWQQPNSGETSLSIYNILGQKIVDHTGNYSAGQNEFIWQKNSNLPSGLYLIQISFDHQVISKTVQAVN